MGGGDARQWGEIEEESLIFITQHFSSKQQTIPSKLVSQDMRVY